VGNSHSTSACVQILEKVGVVERVLMIGLSCGLDALMRDHFGQFGTLQDVRVFKDKGFAFIK